MCQQAISMAYLIAIYYMIFCVPLLWVVALLEGFFVFAYNLEWFGGKFHKDLCFAFSWGFLPVPAGYIMQTNEVTLGVLAIAVAGPEHFLRIVNQGAELGVFCAQCLVPGLKGIPCGSG